MIFNLIEFRIKSTFNIDINITFINSFVNNKI